MKKETKKTYKVIMEDGSELPRLAEAYIKGEFYKDNDFKHMPPMAKGGLADMFNDNADFFNWIAEAQQEVDLAHFNTIITTLYEALEALLNTSICDICYEDDCGGEFNCTKGIDGEPCSCHQRVKDAETKAQQALAEAKGKGH